MNRWTICLCALTFVIGQWVGATRQKLSLKNKILAHTVQSDRELASVPEGAPHKNEQGSAISPSGAKANESISAARSIREMGAQFYANKEAFREKYIYPRVRLINQLTSEERQEIHDTISNIAPSSGVTFWTTQTSIRSGSSILDVFIICDATRAEDAKKIREDGTEVSVHSSSNISIQVLVILDNRKLIYSFANGLNEYGYTYKKDGQWAFLSETYEDPQLAPFISAMTFDPPYHSSPFEYLDVDSNAWVTAGTLNWEPLSDDEYVNWMESVRSRASDYHDN